MVKKLRSNNFKTKTNNILTCHEVYQSTLTITCIELKMHQNMHEEFRGRKKSCRQWGFSKEKWAAVSQEPHPVSQPCFIYWPWDSGRRTCVFSLTSMRECGEWPQAKEVLPILGQESYVLLLHHPKPMPHFPNQPPLYTPVPTNAWLAKRMDGHLADEVGAAQYTWTLASDLRLRWA